MWALGNEDIKMSTKLTFQNFMDCYYNNRRIPFTGATIPTLKILFMLWRFYTTSPKIRIFRQFGDIKMQILRIEDSWTGSLVLMETIGDVLVR